MRLPFALAVAVVAFAAPHSMFAQGRGRAHEAQRKPAEDIPVQSRPPAGMCRIWLDNVPAAQQPAPTDCASAVRNRPAKARVIFGDDYVKPKGDSGAKRLPAIKGFAPPVKKSDTGRRPPLRVRKP